MSRNLSSTLSRDSRRLSVAGVTLAGAAALLSAAVAATALPAQAAKVPTTFVIQTIAVPVDPADPTFNQLLGINDQHLIVGYFGSGAAGHPNKGYQVTAPYQGQYRNENFPGSLQTQVVGVNNNGVTVGFWADGGGNNFGFIERNGVFSNVEHPDAGGATRTTQLLGINDHGTAVGFYNDAKGVAHGFTYRNGTFRKVQLPKSAKATAVTATGITNRGDISGFYTVGTSTFGFVIMNGHFHKLSFGTGTNTQALGLNQSDQVVGSYLDGMNNTHGFVWSNGSLTTIDGPQSLGQTVVNGLNDNGQLVGFFVDAAGNTDGMVIQGRF